MDRRKFCQFAGLAAIGAMSCRMPTQNLPAQRPNILFIMTDDHTAQAMGCYGSRINRTPHIDRIAAEGMRFSNCFCTNAICSPSRAVILTGKYSHVNGRIDNSEEIPFDGSQQTLPKLMGVEGYQTALIGKWHLVSEPTGFDYWQILPGQGSYYNPDFIGMDGSKKRYDGYVTDLIGDFCIDWLDRQRDKGRPFFMMCHHKAPHRCWSPPPRHFDTYPMGTIPEPATLFAGYPGRCSAGDESEMTIGHHMSWSHDMKFKGENLFPEYFQSGMRHTEYNRMTPQEQQQWDAHYEPENQAFIEQVKAGKLSDKEIVQWKYQRYMHDYLGSVAAVDDNIGRVLTYLEQAGLADNTLVVYTSDQGFYLGERGWFDKRFMYEESLRMPLVMRWPAAIAAKSQCDKMVLNLDFASTFLDAAAAPIPADIQGKSFLPMLRGHKVPGWRAAMYYHYYEYPAVHNVKRHYGIRTERYKLIHFYYDIDCWELYDLKEDPLEQKNLYNDPGYTKLVGDLTRQLRLLQSQYGDSDELARQMLPAAKS